jgi:hypothetical protein
MQQQTHP